MAGQTGFSNVAEGARIADGLGKRLLIAEGSGAAIPPVYADATALVVSAWRGAGYVRDFFGPYRLSRADLAIIAFAEPPLAQAADVEGVVGAIVSERPELPVIATTFRPRPLQDVRGKRVFFATTAPAAVVSHLSAYLQEEYGCEVVGTTPHLSNRELLRRDLANCAGRFEMLLTELKAAAIDVVAAAGIAGGVPTVLCDNIPVTVDGSDLESALMSLAHTAVERAGHRKEAGT